MSCTLVPECDCSCLCGGGVGYRLDSLMMAFLGEISDTSIPLFCFFCMICFGHSVLRVNIFAHICALNMGVMRLLSPYIARTFSWSNIKPSQEKGIYRRLQLVISVIVSNVEKLF